jgi:hypothetical protein
MSNLPDHAVEKLVNQIASLAGNEEACKLLGVDGVLEGQLDLAFLNDPLEWLADDISNAIVATQDDDGGEDSDDTEGESLTLDIIVAEYRLCRIILGSLDDGDLLRRVRRSIEDREA